MEASTRGLQPVPAVPRHSLGTGRQMLQRQAVSEAALRPRLPTATESSRVRSLYLCLRQVWERSCVHPRSYLWCWRPPGSGRETKTVLPLSAPRRPSAARLHRPRGPNLPRPAPSSRDSGSGERGAGAGAPRGSGSGSGSGSRGQSRSLLAPL